MCSSHVLDLNYTQVVAHHRFISCRSQIMGYECRFKTHVGQSAMASCEDIIGSGARLSLPYRLKMVSCWKRRFKRSKNPVPPEDPARQITNIDAGRNGDPGGEYRRERSWLIGPMVLIRPRHQIPTTEGVLGSQIRMGGQVIDSSPRPIPQIRLPGTGMTAPVSIVGCGYCGRYLLIYPPSR